MKCDSVLEGAKQNYTCQKDKGHTGHHIFKWTETGIVTIDGEKVNGEIELMTWW